MTLLQLVVMILATWRLSSLLADEEGPWGVFNTLRRLLGVRYDEQSVPYGATSLGRGVLCRWCNSVWCGFLFTAIMVIAGGIPWYWIVFLPLALSAGAILIDEMIQALGRWVA